MLLTLAEINLIVVVPIVFVCSVVLLIRDEHGRSGWALPAAYSFPFTFWLIRVWLTQVWLAGLTEPVESENLALDLEGIGDAIRAAAIISFSALIPTSLFMFLCARALLLRKRRRMSVGGPVE